MKKSLIVTLALVFVLGIAGTAFAAANPFSDVPAKHWAYDAISQLAKAGIVEGYGDGTFKGDKTMTRYEMAIVAAKAMAKADKADAAQKAMIDKLSVEFATELNNLGVRVAKLEANQPNLKFTGAVDFRETNQSFQKQTSATANTAQYRLRLDAAAKVDDKVSYGMRLTSATTNAGGTNFKYFASTFTSFGTNQVADTNKNNFVMDRIFVTGKLGVVTTTVGAQAFKFGAQNMFVDSTAYSYDGLKFAGKSGVVDVTAQWGRYASKMDIASIELGSKIGKLAYGAGYISLKDNGAAANQDYFKNYIVNAAYTFDKKFSLGAEYTANRATGLTQDKNASTIVAIYGDQVLAAKDQKNLVVKYYTFGANGISRLTSFDVMGRDVDPGDARNLGNLKGWNIQYNHAFSKNFIGWLQYVKLTDKDTTTNSNDDGYRFYRIGLTAKF